MELVNNEKSLYTAFLCVGYGVVCGVMFTLLSLWFRRKTDSRLRTALWDISLSFWAALGLFLLSLSLTDGRPRFWLFGGTAAGYFCWKRWFELPFCRLVRQIRAPFLYCRDKIGRLFVPVRLKLQKNVKKTEIFFKKLLKSKGSVLYNRRK